MLKIILISIVFLAIAFAFMALNIIIRKNGKFPEYRVGHNRNMKKIGLSCVKHEEIKCHRKNESESCNSCGKMEEPENF